MRRMKQLLRTGRLEHRRYVGCLGLEAVPHAWKSRMTRSFMLEWVAWSRCRTVFAVLLCWTGTASLVWSQERPSSAATSRLAPVVAGADYRPSVAGPAAARDGAGRTAVARVPVTSSIADGQPQPSRADVENVAPGERRIRCRHACRIRALVAAGGAACAARTSGPSPARPRRADHQCPGIFATSTSRE